MAATTKFRYEIYVTDAAGGLGSPLDIFDLQFVSDPDFVVTETREKERFYYIKKIKSKLNLVESDYQYFIDNFGKCYRYYVKVYKRCEDKENFLALAYFSDKNMDIDKDKCSMDIELEDNSPYNCIKNKGTTKVDVYGVAAPKNLLLDISNKVYRRIDWWQVVLTVSSQLNCCDDFGCVFQPVSDFFNWQKDGFGGTIFPDDQCPPNTCNYVNNTQPNYYLRFAAKSDIKNRTASNPATKVLVSFNDIEQIMREVFNVYFVVEDTYIRWEHYSYFTRFVNYDATSVTNFPFNKFKNKLQFDNDDFPSTETWEFMEAFDVNFIGVPIIYKTECTNGEDKQFGFDRLTTDTEYITNEPTAIDNDGFVLIDCYKFGIVWKVYTAIGVLSAAPYRNVRLSTANIQQDLFRYGRPLINGNMNNVDQTFISKFPNVIQNDIIVENCCTDEYEKYKSVVRTEIGDGLIDEAEVDYTKEQIKFKLRHDSI